MVFSNLVFLFLFLPLFFVFYFAINNRTYRNVVLLIASLGFYAWGEPLYIFIMILSIFINYLFAIKIEKDKSNNKSGKAPLVISILLNILLLVFFKYTDFLILNFNAIFGQDITPLEIPLPIGISFYTFQILSYVVDVYWGDVKVQRNPIYLGAYISAFPQLIAGPIVRYQTIEYELEHRNENIRDFAKGTRRFIMGLGKKVLIANNAAFIADKIFSYTSEEYKFIGALIAVLAYTIQIYFDFSGYSDMAIGLGRMLGFRFLENFNYPYIADSITDFWRRWHISLSTFFRDYIYIPLGGNRVSKTRWLMNILIVWTLTGIWHGASWNYVLWGIYYGLILIIEKTLLGNILKKTPKVLKHIYSLILIVFGWILFRMEDMIELKGVLSALGGSFGVGNVEFLVLSQVLQFKTILLLMAGIVLSTPIFKNIYERYSDGKLAYLFDLGLFIILILSTLSLVVGSFNPFIYFRF